MVQGTASSAGKSILVTALCRILKQDGHRVAPFKAQNMALNSFVTTEGGEIGRSQACQAEAAEITPSIHMNPILLKPQADSTSQLIIQGKAAGISAAADYYKDNFKLLPKIEESLSILSDHYDIIIIEGAGSPAEINLMEREIANMRIAKMAQSPVILVGDIDKGGVFASFVGTLELLPPDQRDFIKGFVINKFRGDISLLKPALKFLEDRYLRPVLGVIPYMRNIGIAQEDSVYLDERVGENHANRPDVCIIRLPHISNYDDFDPLEASCNIRYAATTHEMGHPDLIILPGTKSTMSDLVFLHNSGLADAIIHEAKQGTTVAGICGGYQMLGLKIFDYYGAESDIREADGLGLLALDTRFDLAKITSQVSGRVIAGTGLFNNMHGTAVQGYEIHMGKSQLQTDNPLLEISSLNNSADIYTEGTSDRTGMIFGSYLHGLFHSTDFTRRLLDNLCLIRGIRADGHIAPDKEKAYDALASEFRRSLDMNMIYGILSGGAHGRPEL
ncbi:MAG: cobyric acid synthase [Dehalococcoidia bacterium]|nr:cobyric acid synthase [Dehalococcoidia bacterium]